ncbi:MAG: hypothetical protein KGK08_11240 [Acidobacteriota bacterium]|nr:hypothetical protein [Acidobacteriota bacterium]
MSSTPQPAVHDHRLVVPRPAGQARVLSIGQLRLWYLAQLAPASGVYNVPMASRLTGPLNVTALERALQQVIERHEVLRTVILAPGGKPVPVALKKFSFKLPLHDLRHLPEPEREAAAHAIQLEESARPFDLARDLMLRCCLIQLAEERWVLHHVAPHLAFEGSSTGIFFRDLAAFYQAETTGTTHSLPPLTVQYADFAAWQHALLQGELLEKLNSYWRRQLEGAAQMALPVDLPRPPVHTARGTRYPFQLPPQLLAQAHQVFRDCGTTPYRGLAAAFCVFLYGLTGQTDLSLGSPAFPRCSGVDDVIGFFVNTLVLRVRFSPQDSFRALMKNVSLVIRDAIRNSDLTFDRLVEVVRPPRDPSRTPLFQVNFRAPAEPYPTLALPGIQAERVEYLDNGTSKFDLALEMESSAGEACYLEYCVDLWRPETIAWMVTAFQHLLAELLGEPDLPMAQLPALRSVQAGRDPQAR